MPGLSAKIKPQTDLQSQHPVLSASVNRFISWSSCNRIDYWRTDAGWRCQLFKAHPKTNDWQLLADVADEQLDAAISGALDKFEPKNEGGDG